MYASNSSNVYSSTFVDSPQAVDKILDIYTEDGDHLTQQKTLGTPEQQSSSEKIGIFLI